MTDEVDAHELELLRKFSEMEGTFYHFGEDAVMAGLVEKGLLSGEQKALTDTTGIFAKGIVAGTFQPPPFAVTGLTEKCALLLLSKVPELESEMRLMSNAELEVETSNVRLKNPRYRIARQLLDGRLDTKDKLEVSHRRWSLWGLWAGATISLVSAWFSWQADSREKEMRRQVKKLDSQVNQLKLRVSALEGLSGQRDPKPSPPLQPLPAPSLQTSKFGPVDFGLGPNNQQPKAEAP